MDENQISYEEIDREIEERSAKRRGRLPHEIFDFAELILIVLAILLLATTFLFRQTVVDGPSMDPTLQHGERLIISNFFYTPKANDIIVFQADDDLVEESRGQLVKNQAVVKRVIATEGQTVRVSGGTVYVDGVPLEEPYVLIDGPDERPTMSEITVPPGHLFVMGDHRNRSLDSRWFGVVDERTVLGKVLIRVFPFSAFGGVQ